jgi:pilus assembly protein CpaE
MCEKRQRLDETLINSLVTPHSTNLSLLAAPREADSADEIEPQHIFEVLEKLRESLRLRGARPATHVRLDHSRRARSVRRDRACSDTRHSRDSQHAKSARDLRSAGLPAKESPHRRQSLEQADRSRSRQVEKFLGEPVVGFVPSDYQTAVGSINLGTPLVQAEPTSKIAMEIRRIAQQWRSVLRQSINRSNAVLSGPRCLRNSQPNRISNFKPRWKRSKRQPRR